MHAPWSRTNLPADQALLPLTHPGQAVGLDQLPKHTAHCTTYKRQNVSSVSPYAHSWGAMGVGIGTRRSFSDTWECGVRTLLAGLVDKVIAHGVDEVGLRLDALHEQQPLGQEGQGLGRRRGRAQLQGAQRVHLNGIWWIRRGGRGSGRMARGGGLNCGTASLYGYEGRCASTV